MKVKSTKFLLAVMILSVSYSSIAQIADPPGDADPPAAPINNYIIFLAVFGVYLAYKFIFKNSLKTTK